MFGKFYSHLMLLVALIMMLSLQAAVSYPITQAGALEDGSNASASSNDQILSSGSYSQPDTSQMDIIETITGNGQQYIPQEVIIKLKADSATNLNADALSAGILNVESLDLLSSQFRVSSISPVFNDVDPTDQVASKYGLTNILKLKIGLGVNIQSAMKAFRANPNVEYAEPNYTVQALYTPNDPNLKNQWGLTNKNDKDIDAPEAWNVTTGNSNVLIAVVDSGVLYTHPDLSGGRVRTDIDKDFVNNDSDAIDDNGHGTHIAGIIAANTNNGKGIAGICPKCTILPVKVLSNSGSGSADGVSKGIKYAADKGAQIISMSLGITPKCGCSKTIAGAINYAFDKGSLLIAASGNDSTSSISYPSSSSRVMSIGATNIKDARASWSNYGGGLDLVAPGDNIQSTWLKNTYAYKSGTSMATPYVSGVAGLVYSKNLAQKNIRVWWILQHSADPLNNQSAWNSKVGYGRLNAYKAVTLTKAGVVSAPVDKCSQEPSSDCGGCSTSLMLSQVASADQDRQYLYSFRDDVLSQTPRGKEFTALYYKHNTELKNILLTNSDARNQTLSLYKELMPAMQYVLESGTGKPIIITARQVQSLSKLKTTILEHASSSMITDMNYIWGILALESHIDQDAYSAWMDISQK
ncbi:MAG: S8 family serine peptidase [Chloroflexota bacterium]